MSAVRHNAANNRFELDVEGGHALALYRLADGVMTFTHTEVPAALRGRGIGSQMMGGVLESVRAQGFQGRAVLPVRGGLYEPAPGIRRPAGVAAKSRSSN